MKRRVTLNLLSLSFSLLFIKAVTDSGDTETREMMLAAVPVEHQPSHIRREHAKTSPKATDLFLP